MTFACSRHIVVVSENRSSELVTVSSDRLGGELNRSVAPALNDKDVMRGLTRQDLITGQEIIPSVPVKVTEVMEGKQPRTVWNCSTSRSNGNDLYTLRCLTHDSHGLSNAW